MSSSVWLLRHGETEWTEHDLHTGRRDVPLSDSGREQARRAGRLIAAKRFDHVLVSPQTRALQTCELAGLGANRRTCAELVEWDYGEYEGLTDEQTEERASAPRARRDASELRGSSSSRTIVLTLKIDRGCGWAIREIHRHHCLGSRTDFGFSASGYVVVRNARGRRWIASRRGSGCREFCGQVPQPQDRSRRLLFEYRDRCREHRQQAAQRHAAANKSRPQSPQHLPVADQGDRPVQSAHRLEQPIGPNSYLLGALPARRSVAKELPPWLASWYAADLPKDELDAAALLASELVTNAVVHGTGQIQLRADLDEDRLRIEVMDEGEGFEHTVREVSFEELGGLGLVIVDTIASRWGIYDGSTHVWTEIELSGPRLGEESAVVT